MSVVLDDVVANEHWISLTIKKKFEQLFNIFYNSPKLDIGNINDDSSTSLMNYYES